MSTTPTDHELIERLLVLPADEIRYDSLSTSTLSALATQLSDPFIATSALGELAQRRPQDTKDTAENILDRELWDRHLTAFALTLLNDVEQRDKFLSMFGNASA